MKLNDISIKLLAFFRNILSYIKKIWIWISAPVNFILIIIISILLSGLSTYLYGESNFIYMTNGTILVSLFIAIYLILSKSITLIMTANKHLHDINEIYNNNNDITILKNERIITIDDKSLKIGRVNPDDPKSYSGHICRVENILLLKNHMEQNLKYNYKFLLKSSQHVPSYESIKVCVGTSCDNYLKQEDYHTEHVFRDVSHIKISNSERKKKKKYSHTHTTTRNMT